MSADTAFAIAIQVTIGAWLLLAAIGKVQNLDRTYRAMAAYLFLEGRLPRAAPLSLAVAELILGSLLVVGVGTSFVLPAAAALLFTFSAAMSIDLIRGRRHECGCGGTKPISWRLVVLDVAAGTAALVAFLQDGLRATPADRLMIAALAAAVVLAALVFQAFVRVSNGTPAESPEH
ncbi:MAG TPA: MauE/DoxX family redox-associated membrane protein [Vitreimonas sp.]|nr:MauE/DoxX family redox-associated membrane protein [Vitreimonas sp.]